MHALITGGAGFIGSHLAEALLEGGHSVTIIDDLSTGSMSNIEHLKAEFGVPVNGTHAQPAAGSPHAPRPRFKYIIETITNIPMLAEVADECDIIYHLAAAVGVRLIVESPVRTIETNVRGTEVVLEVANKKKKKVFVFSSSEVYGKSTKLPFSEDDDLVIGPPIKGRWAYACSKALDEFLAIAYWNEKRLPVVVVRLFNTVGPRQTSRYGMVLPSLVRQALADRPITVYGDGKQSRSFTYVGDVVQALLKLSACDRAVGQVFNVGNNQQVTIEELAKRVRALAKSKSEIHYIPYEQAYGKGFEDMPCRVPSITKIRQYVGWEPVLKLDEIIEQVIAYYTGRVAENDGLDPSLLTAREPTSAAYDKGS